MDDKEYLRKLRVNDQPAIAQLYDELFPGFIAYFRSHYSKTRDYSTDLFHESIMVMYQHILSGRLNEDNLTGTLFSYLIGIGNNKLKEKDRKSHELDKEPIYAGEDGNLNRKVKDKLPDIANEDEESQKHSELQDFVERAVSELKPPCSTLLRLFYWDRMKCAEIAKKMDIYGSADSVKTQKNKCMKKLKPIVGKFMNLL